MDDEDPYENWRSAMARLVGSTDDLIRWQDRRYRFAHEIGRLLTEPSGDHPAVDGAVLYGVYVSGVGLAYVGQTGDARRRLRDLPIGESHHLGMTVPPELWEKIVVVRWPLLVDALPQTPRRTVTGLDPEVVGLALEHLVQVEHRPPLNARSRGADGTWRERRVTASRSRGALHAHMVQPLHELVRDAWQTLSTPPPPAPAPSIRTTSTGRVVYPSARTT
ncbi:hypothetical protein [Actinomadura rayongensis]|uniref:Uncharacterized protein n=1 Tax=Actinomadura rayongensis TaxID=1429076 RepID=A0A6I4WB29_9ACTN|nr:hypothetical protein [Actinomadura rayongensis]MXQ65980.1 hypothetical protein [Actinomadura rayongensis]